MYFILLNVILTPTKDITHAIQSVTLKKKVFIPNEKTMKII